MITKASLGIVTARSICTKENTLTDAGLGRLVEALKPYFSRVVLAASVSPKVMPYHDHKLNLAADDIVKLPWMPSIARSFARVVETWKGIATVQRRVDVLLVQLPFAVPLSLLGISKPAVYQVCGDILAVSRSHQWYRRALTQPVALLFDALQRRCIRKPTSRAVTHGRALFEHYAVTRGESIVSSTLLASEIDSVMRKRRVTEPFRVLFAGFLERRKGLDILFDALAIVLSVHQDVELYILGSFKPTDAQMPPSIARAFDAFPYKDKVTWLGRLPLGPALFEQYANADVLVLPSRSDGTPRVLLEARAFGCVVVASSVGGIPESVTDGEDGLLVPPEDPTAVADAILRLYDSPELRQRIADRGLQTSRRWTIESMASILARQCRLALQASDSEEETGEH